MQHMSNQVQVHLTISENYYVGNNIFTEIDKIYNKKTVNINNKWKFHNCNVPNKLQT